MSSLETGAIQLAEQEYPAPVPAGEPDWNESFLLAGFDDATGIGFWMHLGRWRRDHRLWREIFTIALPDGTVLAHRGISNILEDARGPGATNYAIRVEVPGQRLTYSYKGGVHHVPAAELAGGLLVHGYMTPLEMQLTFDAVTPVWDLHQKGGSQDFLGAAHIEQIGRVTGSIVFSGKTYRIDAMGTRDKSMGPRKPRNLRRHHWIQGLFEDGTGFMLFDAEEGEKGFSLAVVSQNGQMVPASIELPFRIEHLEQQHLPMQLRLHAGDRVLDIVSIEIPNSWYLSYTSPIDTYVGVYPTPGHTPIVMLEQSARWMLNGAVRGIGAIERTVPGTIGLEPN